MTISNIFAGMPFFTAALVLSIYSGLGILLGDIAVVEVLIVSSHLAKILFIPAVIALILSIRAGGLDSQRQIILVIGALSASLLLLISSVSHRPDSFYYVAFAGHSAFVIATVVLLAWGFTYKINIPWISVSVLAIALIAVVSHFVYVAQDRILFGDDHPSFLYRLQLLKDHFPLIPFYNTDWNGGYQAREFFPSGVLNVFLVALPFIMLIDLESIAGASGYNYIIAWCFIVVVPLSLLAATRLVGLSLSSGVLAAIAAIMPTLQYFDWLYSYGTLGFAFSMGLLPLAIAFLWKVFISSDSAPSWRVILAAAITLFCTLAWPLSVLVLLPVGVIIGWRVVSLRISARAWLLLLLIGIMNGPWMITFARESKVFNFISGQERPSSVFTASKGTLPPNHVTKRENARDNLTLSDRIKSSRALMSEWVAKANPVVLLLGMVGLVSAGASKQILPFGITFLWLVFLGVTGAWFKPQLELHRMLMAAMFVGIVPAVYSIERIYKFVMESSLNRGDVWRSLGEFSIALSAALFFISPLALSAKFASNSDNGGLIFSPPYLAALIEAIAKEGGEGRVFFPGFILHELGARAYDTQDGGHIAALPLFANKPMYAFNFYHTSWQTVDPIPAKYRRKGREGIEEFLDLVNASSIVTFKREWARYAERRPNLYEEVFQANRFRVWRRKQYQPSYLLEGTGEVRVSRSEIFVRPHSQELVLKFRYHPHLRSSPSRGVKIIPEYVFDDDLPGGIKAPVHFIKLELTEELVANSTQIVLGFHQ